MISGENFKEEEIKTTNSSLWDKAIKILLIDLLKTIDNDKNFNGTFKRLKMTKDNEEEIIKNLNCFYSILFQYLRDNNEKKIMDDFVFVPNERKDYKKLNDVYINKNIDDEIKNIYSYLDKTNHFKTILIPKSINLTVKHQEKCLQDIALVIDREIKKKFAKIDNLLETQSKEVKIEENFKTACTKLIKEWFSKHKEERNKFDFVNSHIPEITMKIIYEGIYKEYMDEIFINGSPKNISSLIENHSKNHNINDNNVYNHNRSYNQSYNQNYQNYNTSQNVSSYSYHDEESLDYDNDYDNSKRNISFINKTEINIFNNNNVRTIPENLKKYFLAQAYVFEDLNNSKLFNHIDWKNKANNDEVGEEITLFNSNKYKIKNSDNTFDFIVTSNNNKSTNIIVQIINEKRYNYIKLKCTVNQWNLFNNEGNEHSTSIFALVRFNLNNAPEILYVKKSNLNEII